MMKLAKILSLILILNLIACSTEKETPPGQETEAFSFAFMTDIHLNFARSNSSDGFRQAIEKARELGVDFIITGGDNVDADVVGDDIETARELFSGFKEIIEESEAVIKVTIGNHDRYWHLPESSTHHGAALFTEYLGPTYYSWEYKGVNFIHINSSEVCDGKYCVSPEQREWLINVLAAIEPKTPVVLIAHVPFLSFYYPALYGYYTHTDVFDGFKEVWDLFKGHNLQLVLQGHMHLFEELKVLDTQFITGGALSGNWWGGPYHGTHEGFVYITWDGKKFSWEYLDYGWKAH